MYSQNRLNSIPKNVKTKKNNNTVEAFRISLSVQEKNYIAYHLPQGYCLIECSTPKYKTRASIAREARTRKRLQCQNKGSKLEERKSDEFDNPNFESLEYSMHLNSHPQKLEVINFGTGSSAYPSINYGIQNQDQSKINGIAKSSEDTITMKQRKSRIKRSEELVMTLKQKKILAQQIRTLSKQKQQMNKLRKIVFGSPDESNNVIDIEKLSQAKLRQLQKFANKLISSSQVKHKNRKNKASTNTDSEESSFITDDSDD